MTVLMVVVMVVVVRAVVQAIHSSSSGFDLFNHGCFCNKRAPVQKVVVVTGETRRVDSLEDLGPTVGRVEETLEEPPSDIPYSHAGHRTGCRTPEE